MSELKSTFASAAPMFANTAIFCVLLYAKITGQTDLSWWWVFAPFWLPLVSIAIIFAILTLIGLYVKKKRNEFKP